MLHVNTPKGKAAEQAVRKAVLKLQRKHQTFAWFPDNNYYPVDGFIVQGNDITAIFECKIREMAYQDKALHFGGRDYDSLLISEDKILNGVEMAKQMQLDFYIIAYLSLSNHYLIFKVYDNRKGNVIEYESKRTQTRANINGGEAIRTNAFLKVQLAKVIVGDGGE